MISIIVAVDRHYGIGYKNTIPWKSTFDMRHFKETTTDNVVFFGRKTYESLPYRPLKNRENVVLTRDKDYKAGKEATVLNCGLDLALCAYLDHKKNVYICGGQQIYDQAIDSKFVDSLIMTKFNFHHKECDTFFNFRVSDWVLEKDDKFDGGVINYYKKK